MALSFVTPALGREIFRPLQDDMVVAKEKWGRIEKVAEGVWAHIATPFESRDFTTVSNGGIIMGRDRVLAIEAFMKPAGAQWIAQQAKKLTGKWPTDVVVTHFHGDHASGHEGYFLDGHQPNLWLTESTQNAAQEAFAKIEEDAPGEFTNVITLPPDQPHVLDLGGRTVTLVPRSGHTNSDISIEISDPKVIWTGDLFFNRMFPNYGDALPKRLNTYAGELTRLEKDSVIVPGHGPLADSDAAKIYADFLSYVQAEAEKAIAAGNELDAAAAQFKLPERLKDWVIWSPDNAKRAFAAWKRASETR